MANKPVHPRWRFVVGLTGIYAIWVIFVVLHHEPWRDEADVWLAARDMSPGQLFHWLGAAGTPGLWYLLVMPLAKGGLPYVSMAMLHVVLAICVAAVVAIWSPFDRVFKVLLIFGFFLSYEYAVVARSYVLTALLLFLIAAALTARVRRWWLLGVLLALLFNSNVHGFFIATMISLVIAAGRLREGMSRAIWIGAIIAAAGCVLAFIQLLPPPGAPAPSDVRRWAILGYVECEAFFPHVIHSMRDVRWDPHAWPRLALAWCGAIRAAGLLILLSTLYVIRRNRAALVIVVLSWAAMTYVSVFKWYGGERHAGLFFLVTIFGLWIGQSAVPVEQSPRKELPRSERWARRINLAALRFSLLVACATAALWEIRDLRWDYSGAKSAAMFIRSHDLQARPIAFGAGSQAEALLPYLPGVRFWCAGREDWGTYTLWNRDWRGDDRISESEVLQRVARHFGSSKPLLLVASKPLSAPESVGYRLIYRNTGYIFEIGDESFYLYEPIGQ